MLPCDDIQETEHAAPLARAGLSHVWKVLEVVRSDVAVDGKLAVW